jgi:hypothetical protein
MFFHTDVSQSSEHHIAYLLYAEQAQYHGLQAVDTRRHALQNPTVIARFKLQNPYI